jgi:hypothetical protein
VTAIFPTQLKLVFPTTHDPSKKLRYMMPPTETAPINRIKRGCVDNALFAVLFLFIF